MLRLTSISIQGMTCTACSNSINDALRQLEGVEEANVLLLTEECKVIYRPNFLDAEKIREAIEDCGFDATVLEDRPLETSKLLSSSVETAVINIPDDFEYEEVQAVEAQLRREQGVLELEMRNDVNQIHLLYDKEKFASNELLSRLNFWRISSDKVEFLEYCGEDIKGWNLRESAVQLRISGMTCGSCTSAIEGTLRQLDGVQRADVSLVTELANIVYNKEKIGIRDIIRAIDDCGFDANIHSSADKDAELKIMSKAHELVKWKKHSLQSFLVAMLVMFMYMFAPMVFREVGGKFPYVQTPVPGLFYRDVIGFSLATYLHLTVGSYFYHSSRKVFSHGSGTMDTLIFVSTSAAYTFSIFSMLKNILATGKQMPNVIFDTSVMLFAFVSIGKLLENKAKAHTLDSLKGFVSLTPATCIIKESSGITREIAVEFLQVNDIIEIKPGMKIPADGIVLEGQSEVNEACLTGESMLVPKEPNSKVICGSVNGPGYFLYRATDVGEDTRVAKIIASMKDAQMMKLPIQKYVDFMASKFVPVVLTLSLLTFTSWLFICYILRIPPKTFRSSEEGSFYMSLQAAISVIVVACPCALGLAAPTALVVGTGIGATNSILFKSGEAIEKCSKVNAFMLDKTGTITTGELTVVNFKSFIDHDKMMPEYWAIINCAEKVSDHPVARAIVRYTNAFVPEHFQGQLQLAKHEVIVGQGMRCLVDFEGNNYDVVIGSSAMMPHKVEHSTSTTESFVSINGTVICVFEFGAMLKKDAYEVVQHLLAKGYYVGMLTGDNHSAAIKVAQEVGIPLKNVYSEVSPENKAAVLQQLKDEHNYRVAFVGDGVNDSPALAVSDFAVSFSSGTELAMEASDAVILEEPNPDMASLKRLVYLLDISEKTFQRLKMNIFWAVFYNTFMIPISMGVLLPWGISLPPLAAGAGMALSSVSVVASSLLLKRWSPPDMTTTAVRNKKPNVIYSLWKRLSSTNANHAEEIEMQEGFLSRGTA